MKELNDVVTGKIGEMISDGTVEKIISEKLEETIKESINSAMRSYSDFGKAITEKINESIQCGALDIEIPAYNQFIKSVVLEKFTQVLEENAATHLADIIEAAIPPINKQEKFSKVIDRISELWLEKAREHGKSEIEIETQENDDGTALYVTFTAPDYGEKTKVTFYNFRDEGWHIGYINEGGHQVTGRPSNIARTAMDDVTQMFFQYYAMQTTFENDAEFCNIDADYY